MPGFFDIQSLMIVVVGGAVGFLSGVFGFGGGFLIVPVLHIGLSMPMPIAVGSAACQVLGPATAAVLARRRSWHELRLPVIVFGGLTLGVFLGADVLHELSSTATAGDSINGSQSADLLVLITYFMMLLILGAFALWETRRASLHRPIRVGWIASRGLPPRTQLPGLGETRVSVPILSWFGLGVGFLSGLLGMSGGLLLLPGLIYLFGMRWRAAVTASMMIVWLVALQSTIAHAWHDHIRLPIVIALLISGTFGARLGVFFSRDFDAARGRRSFGWLALATAGIIGVRLVSLLTPLDAQ